MRDERAEVVGWVEKFPGATAANEAIFADSHFLSPFLSQSGTTATIPSPANPKSRYSSGCANTRRTATTTFAHKCPIRQALRQEKPSKTNITHSNLRPPSLI